MAKKNPKKDFEDNINEKTNKTVALPNFLQTDFKELNPKIHIPHRQHFKTKVPKMQNEPELLVYNF